MNQDQLRQAADDLETARQGMRAAVCLVASVAFELADQLKALQAEKATKARRKGRKPRRRISAQR